MSYSCTISFKQIKSETIYPFLQSLKKEAEKIAPDVAKDEYIWSPIYRWMGYDEEKEKIIKEETFFKAHSEEIVKIERENENWVLKLFTFRWYWDFEKEVLMVYSLPKQLQSLFDNTVGFQDSCDQDYEFEEWSGIKYMEEIAMKWKCLPDETIISKYKERYSYPGEEIIESDIDINYYRKSFCYEDIWDRIEWTLYNDDRIVYLCLFSNWDYNVLKRCNIATVNGIREDWFKIVDKENENE